MTISLYDATVPVFRRTLTNLRGLLDKADAYAAELGFSSDVLVSDRLAPDMRPLSFQVQTATDRAKFGVTRLTGLAAPSWPDDEKTMDELRSRIDKALAFLDGVDPTAFNDASSRTVTIKLGGQERSYSAADYLLIHVLPNIFFHVTTAYAILRHNGVPVGKADFIGA